MASRILPLCALLITGLLRGQPTPLGGTAELHELLDRLNTVGTVLMLGAHPDDENTAVMAYFARSRHLRTVYFSATRGEGGQNLIGTEQASLMGVIRTHELLEARRIDGGEQAFASVVDFGYSKTPEETLGVWGEETLLRDMVRVIRTVRPDLIVARFPPRPGSGGHGQHTAVGWSGPTAYEAAADASRFPELGLPAWRAHRYVYNVPTFTREMEEQAARMPGRIRLDLGAYDPVLGKSYAEIAGESRSMHRSQAMGTSQRKGSAPAYFEVVAGAEAQQDPLEGIDSSWMRIRGGIPVGRHLAAARDRLDPREPEAILPHLLAAYGKLETLTGPEVDYKRRELVRAIEIASGVWLDATAQGWNAVPGSSVQITVQGLRRSDAPWLWRATRIVGIAGASIEGGVELPPNRMVEQQATVVVPEDACFSQPYWLRTEDANAHCQDSGAAPGPSTALRAVFELETPDGIVVESTRPVMYRWVDPSVGERSRPLVVVPPVAVGFTAENRIFPDATPAKIPVRLSSNLGAAVATVEIEAPEGWSVTPGSIDIEFHRQGQEETAMFELTPPLQASGGDLKASLSVEGRTIRSGMRTIEYGHIPATLVFPDAVMRVERVEVKSLANQIGYVMGAGDKIPEAIRQMGAEVVLLTAADLATGDLGRFDALVTGVRALNTRPDLLAARDRVLDYVEKGGTLVVQYNTVSFRRRRPGSGPELTLAPYPVTPSRLRVTNEEARITFVDQDHPLLRVPNRITAADFDGWVQERGLYFMSEWDDRYDVVVACHDPGESSLEGGMLYARYGKGAYVFTGYSWFRQLPAGVPGAFRIFANLISAGRLPGDRP